MKQYIVTTETADMIVSEIKPHVPNVSVYVMSNGHKGVIITGKGTALPGDIITVRGDQVVISHHTEWTSHDHMELAGLRPLAGNRIDLGVDEHPLF